MRGRVRREQHRGRKVVDAHRRDGAAERGADPAEVVEERGRPVPPAPDGAERDRDDEQPRQHACVDDLVDARDADPVDEHRRDAHGEDRQRRRAERQHQHRRERDRDAADTEPRGCAFVDLRRCETELASERCEEHDDRDDDRDDRCRPHPREERRARRVLAVQCDQVRQVRARQEERRSVRHEHRPVEERRLVDAARPARGAAAPASGRRPRCRG